MEGVAPLCVEEEGRVGAGEEVEQAVPAWGGDWTLKLSHHVHRILSTIFRIFHHHHAMVSFIKEGRYFLPRTFMILEFV